MSRTVFIALSLIFTACTPPAVPRVLTCDADNDGFTQSVELSVDGQSVQGFQYTGMAPIGDGTKLSCTFEANRTDGKSEWRDESGEVTISLRDSMDPEDRVRIYRDQDTYTITFEVSPTNCGHSTPIAAEISIAAERLDCFGIELAQ